MKRLDRYARDARTWRDFASLDYSASSVLFTHGDPGVLFAAATLGHHALEMYLKAALICEGMTVFDPKKIKKLDPAVGLKESDCAWGHVLVTLAEQLCDRRPDFNLSAALSVPTYLFVELPVTVKRGFEHFDPFFSELRYPRELRRMGGVGEHDILVLNALVAVLRPFLRKIT